MAINRWNLITDLIVSNKYRKIVEIGPSKGATTFAVWKLLNQNHHYVNAYIGIDPFKDPYYAMEQKMRDRLSMWPAWRLIEQTSDEVLPHMFENELIFVDGSHDEDQMCKDLMNYGDTLVTGGCLVGHDYNSQYPKVTKFIESYFGLDKINIIQDTRDESLCHNYLWWTYKTGDSYAKQRANYQV